MTHFIRTLARVRAAHLAIPFALAWVGCRGGGDDSGGVAGSGGGGAEGLSCPHPGTLPFAGELTDFEAEDARLAAALPRVKDEASDLMGNPGSHFAFTHMRVDEPLQSGVSPFVGRKARSENSSGLSAGGVAGEAVSLWVEGAGGWDRLGRADTDAEGRYELTLGAAELPRVIYSVLEGDGSCTEHQSYQLPRGAKVVVTDIDGTLTISDDELMAQIGDGSYDPKQNGSAALLMKTWAEKGYQVVYLTARPHLFRAETRAWLRRHGFPDGPVISANQLVFGESARTYKRAWVERVRTGLGWEVVAAYGNADSDIDAYEEGGIAKSITFIIGELAGQSGTVAIPGGDFSAHIQDFVLSKPNVGG